MYWTQGNSHALFFYTGNEGPIDQFWDNSGFVFEAAKNCNALVVFAEHVSILLCMLTVLQSTNSSIVIILLSLNHKLSFTYSTQCAICNGLLLIHHWLLLNCYNTV